MSRRHLVVALVAVLTFAAGCNGLSADLPPDGSSSVTAESDSPSLADADFPRGFTRNGVTTSVARTRTLGHLRNDSVEIVARERFRPGAYVDYRYAANATHMRFRLNVHNGEADITRRDTYVDRTARYLRTDTNGRVTYISSDPTLATSRTRSATSLWAVLSRMLVFGEFRATAIRSVGTRSMFQYELNRTVVDEARNPRGCLVVDDEGVVHEALFAYTVGGERKRFEYSVRRRGNVTVDRPDWLSTSPEQSSGADGIEQSTEAATVCGDGTPR